MESLEESIKTIIKEMIEEAKAEQADAVKIKIGAWIKEGQYGKFFSIKVSTYKKPDAAPAPKIDDEDIPF